MLKLPGEKLDGGRWFLAAEQRGVMPASNFGVVFRTRAAARRTPAAT